MKYGGLKPAATIGQRDKQIVIEASTQTFSASNAEVLTWATLVTLWANVTYTIAGQSQDLEANQYVAIQPAKFTILNYSGLTAKHRILYGGKYWDIKNIQEADRGHTVIFAESRT